MFKLASLAYAATCFGMIMAAPGRAAPSADCSSVSMQPVFYRTIKVDGLSIFYREAGRPDAPTLLLLHGFPSSSRMYDPLLSRLSGQFHLVAPDYPGFGHSDAPDAKGFSYTFDHIAEVTSHFTEALGLKHYSLYLQDYGGPVGLRLASLTLNVSRLSSFRTQWRTRMDWARSGRSAASIGQTARRTKPLSGKTFCRLRRPASGTWAPTPTSRTSIRISGRMSSPS
jgi:pimeloyl-ACP methyl ester carboxylesterase